ncbi:MAG: insulinase family protein, partial [Bacteroidota bacterium]
MSREDLIQHHSHFYTAKNTEIIISGKTDGLVSELNKSFGNLGVGRIHPSKSKSTALVSEPGQVTIQNTQNVQAAL